MRWRKISCLVTGLIAIFGAAHAFQRAFREYPGMEYNNFPVPQDHLEEADFAFARLMYPESEISANYGFGFSRRARGDWRQGYTYWTQDYPRADRHFLQALRRVTRIDARAVEQPVNLDDGDDVYNWPWLYAVQVGHWALTDQQAAKLRDYLLRGGFFMCDDFHGTHEWDVFISGMSRVFPDRQIVEIDNRDPIFHTIFDLDDRYQVPGEQVLYTHQVWENDGYEARWRGIYDDKGRLMVAICHNMDLGDSWEHADNPLYPERYSALGIRIGVNYIVYAMTH